MSESHGAYEAFCLRCPDVPCEVLDEDDVAGEVGVPMSFSPDPAVCPVDAIRRPTGASLPEIDAESCIGCGACISRCPVGAISLTMIGEPPLISSDPTTTTVTDPDDFFDRRRAIAESLSFQPGSIDAAAFLDQYETVSASLTAIPDPGAALRVLVRDALVLSGSAIRLKNVGDIYAPCEALGRTETQTWAIEIQPRGDEISGVRRLLAATARLAARHGVPRERITPVLVVDALPNSRAGLYELVEDVEARIDLRVRVLPIALVLAIINEPNSDLVALAQQGMRITRETNSLPRDFATISGLDASLAARVGLEPEK